MVGKNWFNIGSLLTHNTQTRRAQATFRPHLEELEPRLVPADYFWRGGNGGELGNAWSVAANWVNGGNKLMTVAPTNQDTLHFTSGGNKTSYNNQLTEIYEIRVDSEFTSEIWFNQDTTIYASKISGGVLTGGGIVMLGKKEGQDAGHEWSGGRWAGSGSTLVADMTTLEITGKVTLDSRLLRNNGTVNMTNATMQMSGINSAGAERIFNMNGANIIIGSKDDLLATSFQNDSTLRSAVNNSKISVPLLNSQGSTLHAESATLSLYGGGQFAGTMKLGGDLFGNVVLSGYSEAGQTSMYKYDYSLSSSFSIEGQGSWSLQGNSAGSYFGEPVLKLADAKVTVPSSITFGATGGYIEGGGSLTLNESATLNNTFISGGAQITISKGKTLTFGAAAQYGGATEGVQPRVTDSTITARGATIQVNDVTLRSGGNALFELLPDAGAASTLAFNGVASILHYSGSPGGTVFLEHANLTNNNANQEAVIEPRLRLRGKNNVTGGFTTPSKVSFENPLPEGMAWTDGATRLLDNELIVPNGAALLGAASMISVENSGSLAPGDPGVAGLLYFSDHFTQLAGALAMDIGGDQAGVTFDQIQSAGPVQLGGTLNLAPLGTVNSTLNFGYTLIDNRGDPATSMTSGRFDNYPSDTNTVTLDGVDFTLLYNGGDGNDVVLVRNIAPSLGTLPDVHLDEAETNVIPITASDPDANDVLNFTLLAGPAGATILPTGPLTAEIQLPALDGPSQWTVTVKVTDSYGWSDTKSFTLTVGNVGPGADLAWTGPVLPGVGTDFSFVNETDPSAADLAAGLLHSIDFNNDGDFSDPGEVEDVPNSVINYAFSESGTHTIRARVKDKDGGATEFTKEVHVEAPPSLILPGAQTIDEGQPFQLQAMAYDLEGGALQFALIAGPAGTTINPDTGVLDIPALDGPAAHTVTVRVTDPTGLHDEKSFQLGVNNVAPSAVDFQWTANPVVHQQVSFWFVMPTDPSQADLTSGLLFLVDFDDDGVFDYQGSSPTTTHTFTTAGWHSVHGRVQDKDGGFTDFVRDVFVSEE